MRGHLKSLCYWSIPLLTRLPSCQGVDVMVCSHGGVGTTFISEFISRYLRVNDPYDRDHSKHIPLPPRWISRDIKIIYVYGNPSEAAMSLFARGYAALQSSKNGVLFPVERNESFESYLERGEDRLGLTAHLSRWANPENHRNNVFLVKYDKLWENTASIISFLGLDPKSIDLFPERKTRKSCLRDLSERQTVQLRRIYERYTSIERSMADVQFFHKK